MDDSDAESNLNETPTVTSDTPPNQKKAKLAKQGVCTPKTAEEQAISSEIVVSMVEEADKLKSRQKRASERNRRLLHTLSVLSAKDVDEVLAQVFYLG